MMKYLFIGGAGHSGTTMLNKIFAKNTKSISTLGESRIFESNELLTKEFLKIQENNLRYQKIADLVYNGYKFKKAQYTLTQNCENPFVFDGFDTAIFNGNVFNDIKSVIEAAGKYHNKSLFVEKSPSNVFHIAEITKIIPESKILIVHRDVRDVVASLKKRFFTLKNNPSVYSHNLSIKKLDKDYNLVLDSLMWCKTVLSAPKSTDNVKVIRYEDFVLNPELLTKNICSWLEIPFEPEMIAVKNFNSSDLVLKDSEGITVRAVGNYREILNPLEIAVVQRIAKKELNHLNYELDKIPFVLRIKSSLLFITESIKILQRLVKRFKLMKFSYFLNFLKRSFKKLLS